MADPGMQALQAGTEMLAGSTIPFRFEVTWRSLTRSLGAGGTVEPVSQPPAGRSPVQDLEAKEWEMVLPRMKRPAALAPTHVPERLAPPAAAPINAPDFAIATGRSSRRWMFPAGAALLIPVALAVMHWTEKGSTTGEPAVRPMQMGGAGWISEWASDSTGSARGRQISLYRPSMPMSDYRLEFMGSIERKSLGWVFRAVDSKNYYVGKLESYSPGLAVTRFAVIRGVEGPHIQRMLPIAVAPGAMLKVRLDANGPRFTVFVQNQAVEDWEDDRLKSGGVGFLNERDERAQIGSIQISFPKGGRQ